MIQHSIKSNSQQQVQVNNTKTIKKEYENNIKVSRLLWHRYRVWGRWEVAVWKGDWGERRDLWVGWAMVTLCF